MVHEMVHLLLRKWEREVNVFAQTNGLSMRYLSGNLSLHNSFRALPAIAGWDRLCSILDGSICWWSACRDSRLSPGYAGNDSWVTLDYVLLRECRCYLCFGCSQQWWLLIHRTLWQSMATGWNSQTPLCWDVHWHHLFQYHWYLHLYCPTHIEQH